MNAVRLPALLRPGLVVALLAGLSLAAGCDRPRSAAATQQVGSVTVRFLPNPDPPRLGENTRFTIALSDQGGPVSGASVYASLTPEAQRDRAPEVVANEDRGVAGRYVIPGMALGVPGQWQMQVRIIDVRHGTMTARFPFPVVR